MDFSKLQFLPIDVPSIPRQVAQNIIDSSGQGWKDHPTDEWEAWKFIKLTKRKRSHEDVSEFTDYAKTNLSQIVEWIEKNFPYKTIRNVKFNRQVAQSVEHLDYAFPKDLDLYHNNQINEPCGYRTVITGSKSGCLYLVNNQGERIYPTLPDTTDTYVIGTTNTLHGVEEESERETLYMHFEIDSKEHQKLLERSLEKYREFAVWY